MKIISFIIPAFNSEDYLSKCIDSIIGDDSVLDKIEIIIVNDGSTDKTKEIAEAYSIKYPHTVKVITQQNKGHGGALNTGCNQANAKYLKVIDADDWIETSNVKEFIKLLEACESDVVLTHHYTVNISNGEIKQWKTYPSEFIKAYSISQVVENYPDFERGLTFHGITYKTDFYKENAFSLSEHIFFEDHEYATFPCCFAKTISSLDLFIYNYRIGDLTQSVSEANQLKRVSHYDVVLKRLSEEYRNNGMDFDSPQGIYVSLKIKTVLLSYLTTLLLINKERKKGRNEAKSIMAYFKTTIPYVYSITHKKYKAFLVMNYLRLDKSFLNKLLSPKVYPKLNGSDNFE